MIRLRRWWAHRWERDAAHALPPAALERIRSRIAASEALHAGEIRVCVEAGLPNSYLLRHAPMTVLLRQRALALFGRLRVWDTECNTGVLIYLCTAERAIELVADRGINRHVSAEQWQAIVTRLASHLQAREFEAGLNTAIDDIHQWLICHYPTANEGMPANELPDSPVLM